MPRVSATRLVALAIVVVLQALGDFPIHIRVVEHFRRLPATTTNEWSNWLNQVHVGNCIIFGLEVKDAECGIVFTVSESH